MTAPKHHEQISNKDRDEDSLNVEKANVLHQEIVADEEGQVLEVDCFGAKKKTNPAEIRLVKKLDLWIIPTL